MRRLIGGFARDRDGSTAVEYAVIIAVLTLTIVSGIGLAGNSIEYLWSNNNSRLVQAIGN